MTTPRLNFKPLRILISEGNSTSAREAVTVLGLAGHVVDICDPAAFGLARFSRFVRTYHRCPGMRDDPQGFLDAAERLLEHEYDVLLPIHEQGLLFAKVQQRFVGRVGLALPDYADYRRAHSKVGFSRLLTELGLPQPPTEIVATPADLRAVVRFPCVIKTAIGTASRGVWMVRDVAELTAGLQELQAADGFTDEVLVQTLIAGATEKAQGVFCRGVLIGFHATRQLAEGAGGGDAIKRSVRRDRVREDLARIGRHLDWHGALSIDFIMPDDDTGPFYIDCNPRLVEPMAAWLAGVDLVELLLRVSLGETPDAVLDGREGVVSHQAMQVSLGCAQRGGGRRDLLRIWCDIVCRRGDYTGSTEELTPVRIDWMSGIPLAMTALLLLISPALAHVLIRRGWGAHLLDAGSIAMIDREIF